MSSDEHSVKITIYCPICKTMGQVRIEKNIVTMSDKGVTAVNVAENLICEHSFVTYIDKNLDIRDSFVCDFRIEIPQIGVPEIETQDTKLNFDLSIVKINLIPSVLARIIRAVLMGEKIVFISEQEFLNGHYIRFLEYVFGATFNIDLIFLTNNDYKKNKKNYKNHIVIDSVKVIRDKKKLIEQSKLKIELAFVQQFYKEYDEITSLIIFKNEIDKIERIIHQILKFHKTQKEGREFNTKQAINYLRSIYKIIVPLPYFNFLLDIIESYFSINLNRPSKMIDFLGLM
ncbi:MAG: hypothetical protein ACFFBP_15435 [Promethearchaeota archaeon]